MSRSITRGIVIAVFSTLVLSTSGVQAQSATPPPSLRIGDYWFYVVTRTDTPGPGQLNISVAAALPTGYSLDVLRRPSGGPTQSTWRVGSDLSVEVQSWSGGATRFDPALREIPFPLDAGAVAEQSINVTVQPAGANATWSDLVHRSKVVRTERLNVRAGEFDSFMIERVEIGTNYTYSLWYSAEVGGLIKREYRNGAQLEETWELAGYSFGSAPPPRATIASLGPIGAGVVVGALALFAMALMFLWRNGKLVGKRRRLPRPEPSTSVSTIAKPTPADVRKTDRRGGRGVSTVSTSRSEPNPRIEKKARGPKKPRPAGDGRRRTPEELEAEYGRRLEKTRARLKSADGSKGETKQARLLLSRAQMAAKQERHQEAIDLLVTAMERLEE